MFFIFLQILKGLNSNIYICLCNSYIHNNFITYIFIFKFIFYQFSSLSIDFDCSVFFLQFLLKIQMKFFFFTLGNFYLLIFKNLWNFWKKNYVVSIFSNTKQYKKSTLSDRILLINYSFSNFYYNLLLFNAFIIYI